MNLYNSKFLKRFLPLLLILILTSAIVYTVNQQTLRQGTNTILVEQAYNIVGSLKTQSTKGLQASNSVDVTNSTQEFIIILDSDNKPLYSTIQVDGSTPSLPNGVSDQTNKVGRNSFTWSPKSSIRLAAVTMPYTSTDGKGIVLVGKSLHDVENATRTMGKTIALMDLIGGLILAALIAVYSNHSGNKNMSHTPGEIVTPKMQKVMTPLVKAVEKFTEPTVKMKDAKIKRNKK